MGVRRQAREVALQLCYMCETMQSWDHETIVFCLDYFRVPKTVSAYALKLGDGVSKHLREIDSKISLASEHWSLSRMSKVDRALLRLSAFEMLYGGDVPHSVSINEAIEISKRFCEKDSPMFINGVLDRIASSLAKQIEVTVKGAQAEEEKLIELDEEELAFLELSK